MDHALDHKRVLIVEDEALLALDIEMILTARGCRIVGPIGTVAAAIGEIEQSPPDAAVLDLNLSGESALPVADALARYGVPFVFVSGYDRDHLPDRHRAAALVGKPYQPTHLVQTLIGTLHRLT